MKGNTLLIPFICFARPRVRFILILLVQMGSRSTCGCFRVTRQRGAGEVVPRQGWFFCAEFACSLTLQRNVTTRKGGEELFGRWRGLKKRTEPLSVHSKYEVIFSTYRLVIKLHSCPRLTPPVVMPNTLGGTGSYIFFVLASKPVKCCSRMCSGTQSLQRLTLAAIILAENLKKMLYSVKLLFLFFCQVILTHNSTPHNSFVHGVKKKKTQVCRYYSDYQS